MELLGGHWGKIPLQTQYQDAEHALFETPQHQDESNDSYIARADILWSRLLDQKMDISEVQAYILLRGSLLSIEEKKRVVLESEKDGKLTVERVTDAIRNPKSSVLSGITGQKKGTRTKVYEHANLALDASVDDRNDHEAALNAADDIVDDFIEEMIQEGDSDALLISGYEQAMTKTLMQEDAEFATAYSAYQQARHRFRNDTRTEGSGQLDPLLEMPPRVGSSGQQKVSPSISLAAIDPCRKGS